MAVKPIIIPIEPDVSSIPSAIETISALGGVDEATAKKFIQSNKAFAEQQKVLSGSIPQIDKLIAAINGLTESIVGGALTQKITQLGTVTQKSADIASGSSTKINELTASLSSLKDNGDVSVIEDSLTEVADSISDVASSADVLHASFSDFSKDAQKVDFTKLSVEQLEKTLDELIKTEGLLKSAQKSTLNPELIKQYQEGLESVTRDINEVSQLLDNANANKFLPPVETVSKFSDKIKQLTNQLKNVSADSPEFDKLKKELDATKISAERLEKTAGSLRGQLRQYKETLSQLEDAGLESTEVFQNMAVAAGKLEDQIGDTQARIKALASDTFAFDAAIQGAQGIAAAFSVAEGATAILGAEDEDLQKAILGVNSAMAILTGLQEIENTLQQQTAIVTAVVLAQQKLAIVQTQLQSATESRNIIIRYAAIAAQKVLNAVMAANPATIVLIGIAALATGLLALTHSSDDAAEALEDLNKVLEFQNEIIKRNAESYQQSADLLSAQARQAGALESELSRIQQDARRRQAEDLAANITLNQLRFKNEKLTGDQIIAINKQIEEDTKRLNELNNQGKIAALQIQKQTQDESLKSATAFAEARIANAKKDSAAESSAMIEAIRAQQREQLSQESLTAGERQKIVAENEAKIRQINQESALRSHNDKIALAQSFAIVQRDLFKKLEAETSVILLEAERDRLGKSKEQQTLITAQANEAVRNLRLNLFKELETAEGLHDEVLISERRDSFEKQLKFEQDLFNEKSRLRNEGFEAEKQRLLDEKLLREELDRQRLQAAASIANSLVEFSKNRTDAEIADLDNQLKKGLISQEQYDLKVRALKRRQAQQDKQAAIFQATIAQSLAVLSVLKDQTIPFVAKPAFIALIIAQAVAQIAAIASRPLPAYAKGTKNAIGGNSIVAEEGPELIYQKGKWSYVDKPSIVNLARGSKVITAPETSKILSRYNIPMPYLEGQTNETINGHKIDYQKMGAIIGNEIGKLPLTYNFFDQNGFTSHQASILNRRDFIKHRYKS
ncbi:hypothetical protein [Chitinophaga nivalis]|uniref:Uncharacterized protein n=1 Tax=Chitinophaga nivalis TaxID=2991709 RepID=A0ABT3IIQ0_9BACT|nr:hypothetical protein [Chitinophaga nivalis]MCW3466508.1 hypothetical protein [Chitinophaga nivalis]MCW3483801.1 hypothetical protein [Chitinophaga nivalis]